MLNKKTMGDPIQPINLDARVVKTVRNLKLLSSRNSDSGDDSTSTNPQNLNSIEKSEEDR
jgi:hypothetical protein